MEKCFYCGDYAKIETLKDTAILTLLCGGSHWVCSLGGISYKTYFDNQDFVRDVLTEIQYNATDSCHGATEDINEICKDLKNRLWSAKAWLK